MIDEKKEVTKCEKGHVYDSRYEKCPLCNGKTMEEMLKELQEAAKIPNEIKMPTADCYFAPPHDF